MSREFVTLDDIDDSTISCINRPGLSDLYSVDQLYPLAHSVVGSPAQLSMDDESMQLLFPGFGWLKLTNPVGGGDPSIILSVQGVRINLTYPLLFPDSSVRSCQGTFRKGHEVTRLLISNNPSTSQIKDKNQHFNLLGVNHIDLDVQNDHLFRHGEMSPFENGTICISFDCASPHRPHMLYNLFIPHILSVNTNERIITRDYWHAAHSLIRQVHNSPLLSLYSDSRKLNLYELLEASGRFMGRHAMLDMYPLQGVLRKRDESE